MHARRSKVVAVFTAAVVLLAALAAGSQAQPKASEAQAATIKVGIIYSRTGLLGPYGAEYLSGLRWGLNYATGGTGKVNGNDVEPDASLLDGRILEAAASALAAVEPWAASEIEAALKQLCDDLGEKPRAVYLPIRVAVTGSRVSPGLYESLELLGKETSLARLEAVKERLPTG